MFCRQLYVSNDRSADKAVLHRHHVRVSRLIENFDRIQADVEELVDRLEHTGYREVVFELDGDTLVGKGLED